MTSHSKLAQQASAVAAQNGALTGLYGEADCSPAAHARLIGFQAQVLLARGQVA